MKTLSLVQGTPEWAAHRATHFNASDAPAMMGASPYKTRNELLQELSSGIAPEVDAGTQSRFDEGHRAEALARPLGETIIGEELYPVVGSEGRYSASFDGLTLMGDVTFEHKSLNDAIRACKAGSDLPLMYRIQMEQQLMVSGATKCLFMASKWNGDDLAEEVHFWYVPDSALRARIVTGWEQFATDLENFKPPEVIPAAAAAPIKDLPTLFIQARGEVTNTNMPVFKAQITEFLGTINMKPATDQEFADGKEVAKKLRELAVRIKERKADMLAQTATIGEVAVEIDHLAEVINANALELEKAVKREEDARKLAIVSGGRTAFAEYVATLNARLGKPYMPSIAADFAEAIKGKRLMTAMQDAVDTLLSQKKIEANEIAGRIQDNLNSLRELAKDHAFLFADTPQIVLKANDDLVMLIKSRIAEHKDAEEKRLEAEREKIRKEEESKAAEKVRQEQATAAQEAADKIKQDAALNAGQSNAGAAAGGSQPVDASTEPCSVPSQDAQGGQISAARVAPAPDNGKTIKLGEICTLLGFTVSADFLAVLGFEAKSEKNAKLYREAEFPAICAAIIEHVQAVANTDLRRAA